MLKNIKLAGAALALSLAAVSANAATIDGDLQISGSLDFAASDFSATGNVDFNGAHVAQNGSGDLSVLNPFSLVNIFDIDFTAVGQTLWTTTPLGGGVTFEFIANSFSGFDAAEGQFTATGILKGTGFDDTNAVFAFDVVSLGGSSSYTSELQTIDAAPAPVPLPAAGFLLVGALGGLAAAGRRKAKKA